MNAEYEKLVGGNIRKLREERRLTQEQLSARLQIHGCDITRSALAKIEAGQRHLYPDEIYCLKQILAVSYERLLEDVRGGGPGGTSQKSSREPSQKPSHSSLKSPPRPLPRKDALPGNGDPSDPSDSSDKG